MGAPAFAELNLSAPPYELLKAVAGDDTREVASTYDTYIVRNYPEIGGGTEAFVQISVFTEHDMSLPPKSYIVTADNRGHRFGDVNAVNESEIAQDLAAKVAFAARRTFAAAQNPYENR